MENDLTLIFLSLMAITLFFFFFYKKKKKLRKEKIKKSIEVEQSRWQKKLENDKERITASQIETLIPTLNLSDTILTLFQGNCNDDIMKKHSFDKNYSMPYEVFHLTKEQQDVYLIDRYKPILAYATEKIVAYDTKLKGFNQYYLEMGMQSADFCYTWDGIFISQILFWWEYEIPDSEILHIGNYFGLKHTEKILKSIYKDSNGKGFSSNELMTAWEDNTLNEIQGIIK